MEIKGFTFFRSYYAVLQDLEEAERAELLQAMLEFVFDGVEPELSKPVKPLFTLMRPNLEKSIRNAQNGALGGAPKGNQNARKDPAEKDLNENLNKKENKEVEKQAKNNRETSEKQATFYNFSLSILNQLNSRTGAGYTPEGRNLELLTVLFEQGHTVEEILQVVNRKCDEWLEVPKMRVQLTPAVLFKPENFERYLQAPPTEQEEERKRKEQAWEKARQIAEQRAQMSNEELIIEELKKDLKRLDDERYYHAQFVDEQKRMALLAKDDERIQQVVAEIERLEEVVRKQKAEKSKGGAE